VGGVNWIMSLKVAQTEMRDSPVMVKAAQSCDVVSEPVILIRILRDGISWEVRDAGHAET
jgi:hypothetical protein